MNKLTVSLRNTAPMRLAAEFDCASGELVALVGPSGSGKTSLLRAVAGLLRAPGLQGRITVGSEAWFDSARGVNLTPQQRHVGLVFQHYALFPHLTAGENVEMALRAEAASGAKGAGPRVRLEVLFDRLGLSGLQHRRPAQLSGGQQQRVALARALVRVASQEPGVLLLDEPFSAVDAPTRQTLYRELATLRQSLSTPMVLVTHDLSEARRLADRVVILDAGETLQTGTPAQVFASPRNARVAELVGLQNHFAGRFFKHEPDWGRLQWGEGSGALQLRVADKNRIDDGVAVTWVIAGELVDVGLPATDDEPSGNSLCCQVQEMLSLGETSLCTLVPESLPHERVTLNLSSALLRGLQARPGTRLRLHIAPAAVHIMPVRGTP
jgi:molybdate transport system ATP-binding protein